MLFISRFIDNREERLFHWIFIKMVFKPLLVKAVKFQGLKLVKSETPLFIIKSRRMSTSSEPGENVILSEIINRKGIITLNRPRKLNCANLNVFRSILHKLIEWENKVEMVIIKGQGRAFSAGGDVVSITEPGPKNNKLGKEYMLTQYTLNGLIGQYPMPYVALIDGITMGAGVGMSAHGTVRIATENTLFAMPETLIGLYPDVGTSYILSRMPYHLGQYLALTGHRLQGTDVVKAGIATHFTKSENLLALEKGLIDLNKPEKNLNEFLSKHTEDVSEIEFSLVPHLELIEKCFSASSVEEIMQRLQSDGSDFTSNTLNTLKKMSPISMKITKKLLEITKDKTLDECLTIDNRLSRAAIDARVSPDFFEGVRALLIDKDRNPKWNPSTLGEVTDKMVDKAFEKLSPEEELNFRRRLEDLRIRIKSNI